MKIIKIGRSSSNDVNINDPLVSRVHCQIIQDDYGNFRIVDTNSANGTFINGTKRHGEVQLNASDIVRIGNTTLPWQTYFNNAISGGGGSIGRTQMDGSPGNANSNSNRNSIHINMENPTIGGGGYVPPSMPKPSSFLVWAILSTIFCCFPFGVVSIVNASKVDTLWYAGQYVEAQNAARKARTWFWWAFAIGLLQDIGLAIYYLVVIVSSVGASGF